MDVLVAPMAYAIHRTDLNKDIYAESDAKEEHNHLNHFVLQTSICLACEGLIAKDSLAVDYLIYHPKYAKYAKSAKEWRQVCEPVERGNEP